MLQCPSLLTLSVSAAAKITDVAISKVRPSYIHTPRPSLSPAQVLAASPRLQGVDVSGCSVSATDFSSSALTSLNLSNCKLLTEAVRSPRPSGVHTTLTRTQLFQRLPHGCPHLQRVELRECETVTDEFLKHLSKCPSLQHVDLSRCPRVTDTGVALLVKHASSLVHLDLSWCPLLTERTLDYISACLRGASLSSSSSRSPLVLSSSAAVSQIRCLKVFGCAGMRAEVVDAFKARFPHVEFRYAIAPRDWATLESI